MNSRAAGFSLVEIVVALAIMAILLMQAVPQLTGYVRDAKVRAAAEAFLGGLQRARSEAVRRNTAVEILFTTASPVATSLTTATTESTGSNWLVRTTDQTEFIEGKALGNDSGAVSISRTVDRIVFNDLGRTALTADASVNFTSPQGDCVADGGTVRCLRVLISMFGQARLCDPRLASSDARSCP